MKKINKTTLMLFALVLSLSVTVGATLAYFSDYEQASGGATLRLGGQTKLTEGDAEDQKNIKIENTGETNTIVRVGIYGPDGMDDPIMDPEKWKLSSKDGMYYYLKVLKPGDSTEANSLIAHMNFHWTAEEDDEGNLEVPDYYFEVTVVHEGAQAIYDDNNSLVAPTNPLDPNNPDGPQVPYWDADVVALITE